MFVDPSLIFDPTMSRTRERKCTKCGHNIAIFFRSADYEDKQLQLTFICAYIDKNGVACGNNW